MCRRLPAVLEHFGIVTWDVLLVGDGSGFNWKIGCGWGCVVIDHSTLGRKLLWGGWSQGTVGIAELMPYLHGLMWYHHETGYARRRQFKNKLIQAHVISDCENIVLQGNDPTRERKALAPIWASIEQIKRMGYNLRWHYIDRDRLALNDLTDMVSKQARVVEQDLSLRDMTGGDNISVYDFNPS